MLANLPEGETLDGILTYQEYLESIFPKDEDGKRTDEVTGEILRLQTAFAKPGGPGAKFKNQ